MRRPAVRGGRQKKMPLLFVQLENCHKGFGGQLHSTQGTHFLLAFLLLLQQLLLSGDAVSYTHLTLPTIYSV